MYRAAITPVELEASPAHATFYIRIKRKTLIYTESATHTGLYSLQLCAGVPTQAGTKYLSFLTSEIYQTGAICKQ